MAVMTRPLFSEFFGMKQRVDEIGAEQQRDAKTYDGLRHEGLLSQAAASAGVDAHQREQREAEGDKGEIEHGWSPKAKCECDMPATRIRAPFGFPPGRIRDS
jgi:hypothetical protein